MSRQTFSVAGFFTAVVILAAAFGCSEEGKGQADEASASVGVIEVDEFLTNINDPSGQRYAKLKLRLAVAPEENVSAIRDDSLLMARVRDQILTLLSSKTFGELNGPGGKEDFRNQVHARLKPLFEDGELKEVLFAEFVVQ